MSILDNLPHLATARLQTRTADSMGGTMPADGATLFTDRPCWRQAASDREVTLYQKRGIAVTHKVYFVTDPEVDENHHLTDVRNKDAAAGTGDRLEVRSRAHPDASVGLGIVYRVMCEFVTIS